ncbi:MAG: AbrB/MazE/SpoVT family DNA-binding domain-containing protein [Actinobacteria bacterium]|nr:AbrB/MazE/SpoVT family DNA-binding domain-containing protein [Actinomycetota bacterium]
MGKKYKTMIDKFGHIVIPKKIRNSLGLSPNIEIEIEEDADTIVINPKSEEPLIVNKEGVLVIKGELTESAEDFLERNRTNRIKNILKDFH